MMRRFGAPPRRGQMYRDRPGVYALISGRGGLLLTASFVPEFELQLPGGGIDPGESPLVALHREVREETGWRIDPIRCLGRYQRFTYMPEYGLWARKICAVYLARPVLRLGPPGEPHHHPIWMPPELAEGVLESEGDRWFVRSWAGLPGSPGALPA
ncbi:MAG: NUDIX hydrolase [Pseudomonadota bacterium]